MTNLQCYSYGIKAIANLKTMKVEITPDSFFHELYYLWDIYSEEAIQELVQTEEVNGKLM